MTDVTRPPFNLSRVPTFLVVHGRVQHIQGSRYSVLDGGDFVSYMKHGTFVMEYVGDSYAVISHHFVANGWLSEVKKIFIPPTKRIYISRGIWHITGVNYPSFQQACSYPRSA